MIPSRRALRLRRSLRKSPYMPLCSSATHDELCVWIESESLLSKYLGGWSDAGPPSRGGWVVGRDGCLKYRVHLGKHTESSA